MPVTKSYGSILSSPLRSNHKVIAYVHSCDDPRQPLIRRLKYPCDHAFGNPKAQTLYWSSFFFKPLNDKTMMGDLPIRMELNKSETKVAICFRSPHIGSTPQIPVVITHILDIIPNTKGYVCVYTNSTESRRRLMMDRIITVSY